MNPLRRLRFRILILLALCTTAHADDKGVIVAGNARFTVITPNLIRIEYSQDKKFIDDRSMFAIDRSSRLDQFDREGEGDSMTIDTGAIRLSWWPSENPTLDNISADIHVGNRWVDCDLKQKDTNNLGGTIRTLDGVSGPVDVGQGLLSRKGWFLLDDSRTPLLTDTWVKSRPKGAGTDWYLFGYGNDYRAALKSLAAIAGPVPMPRKYMLGAWYSRYWPYTSDEFKQIVSEYREHDFPLDVIVMDMDWHITQAPGANKSWGDQIWTGYTWDKKLIPDPAALLRWFHEQGLHVTLNDHPADGVQPHESMYDAFMRDMGEDPATKKTIPFDAGDEKYLTTFWRHTHQPLLEGGVDFWWLDWQQFPFTRSVADLSNLAWLNRFYYQHTTSNERRGASFSRWAGWGDHRHPIHFSGDADTGWPMLAFEVPFTSTAGNVGCFFWSHDIGGHMGGRNEESYTRWCQFGAMSAALRSHSTRNAQMDRRPWKYPQWAEDSMRRSFQLRSQLFPYIYTSVAQSCREMVPLTRPMYFDWPDDEHAYHNPQQYLLGDNILVAPIASPGVGPRKLATQVVWFPPRTTWYNFFTGEKFEGGESNGSEQLVAADIDEFPLYVRAGMPIPMQPFTQRMGTDKVDTLVIRVYPGVNSTPQKATLYEDDGMTTAYRNKNFATTELTCSREFDGEMVKIDTTVGDFDGQPKERSYVIEFANTAPDGRAMVDGDRVPVEHDSAAAISRVRVPARSIIKPTNVRFQGDYVDPAHRKALAMGHRALLPTTQPQAAPSGPGSTTAPVDDQVAMMYRALGAGIIEKNESATDSGKSSLFLYAPADRIGEEVHWSLVEEDSSRKRNTLATATTPAAAKQRVPEFSDRKAPSSWRNTVAVIAEVDLKVASGAAAARYVFTQTLPTFHPSFDVAMSATATASSCEQGYSPAGAIDGVASGYPHGKQHEWASEGEKTGATLKLEWKDPQHIDTILLFDRPNKDDQITSAVITFDDGTTITVGELQNNGDQPAELKFKPKDVKSLDIKITGVSKTTRNAGLSEIVVLKAAS